MVSNSHGCCVFIDAYALVHDNVYIHALEDVIKQVMVIASLVYLNDSNYPFAVILTKCDRLNSDLAAFSIRRGWQRFEDNFPTELCSDVSIDSDQTQQLEPQE